MRTCNLSRINNSIPCLFHVWVASHILHSLLGSYNVFSLSCAHAFYFKEILKLCLGCIAAEDGLTSAPLRASFSSSWIVLHLTCLPPHAFLPSCSDQSLPRGPGSCWRLWNWVAEAGHWGQSWKAIRTLILVCTLFLPDSVSHVSAAVTWAATPSWLWWKRQTILSPSCHRQVFCSQQQHQNRKT